MLASSVVPQEKIKHPSASADHSLWRVDLHSLEYPADSSQLQLRRGLDKFNTVDFLSESVVAATFITREDVSELQRRDDPSRARPYKLHAVFLDASTGKVLKTMDWPVDDPVAGIFPRFDGSFLFFTNSQIVLYSADWSKVKELPLSQWQELQSSLSGISQSPTGKSLVIQFHRGLSTFCLRIQTDKLDVSESPCEILELFTASDDRIAAPRSLSEGNSNEGNPAGPIVQVGGTAPGVRSDTSDMMQKSEGGIITRTFCNSCVGIPQFINNDEIVIYAPQRISMTAHNGDLKFALELNPRDVWIDEFGRPVRPSANGRRFAVAYNASLLRIGKLTSIQMSTGDMPAAFPGRIDAYDLATGQWIYSVLFKGTQLQQIWGLALSPSGEKLAVDSGGVIQVYALPPNSQLAPSSH